jgi:hypothetical protein
VPLPVENEAWPTPEWAPVFDQYATNAAWLEANADALATIYGGAPATRGDSNAAHLNTRPAKRSSLASKVVQFFVGKLAAGGGANGDRVSTRLVSPLAGNIATLSSDKLMGVPPTFRLEVDGDPVAAERQRRVDDMFATDEFKMRLSNAAEQAAGLSGVVLTAHWDRNVSDRPWMEVTGCDAAIPEWEGGRLVAVNLWTTYPTIDAGGTLGKVYYHVERHEPGAVIHALYQGKRDTIGVRVPFDVPAFDLLAYLPRIPGSQWDEADRTLTLPTGIQELTATYWANRPTRQFRKSGIFGLIGRADTEGGEPFLDAASFTWSSWMRDLRVARARMVVPQSMLDFGTEGSGGLFDDDSEIITGLNYTTLGNTDETISAHQFAIRSEEHGSTLLALTKEVLQLAGYSLSSYGEFAGGPDITATEVQDRTTNTTATNAKKQLQFSASFAPFARAMLALDAVHYGAVPQGDAEIIIEWPDTTTIDPLKQGQAFQAYYAAYSASIETLVRMMHPDWDADAVGLEVAAIKEERGLNALADPTQEFDSQGRPIVRAAGDDAITEPTPGEGDAAEAGDPEADDE